MSSTPSVAVLPDLPQLAHPAVRDDWLATLHESALDPELPIVDAHHHLWDRDGGYQVDDFLADVRTGHRIEASVFVQCGHAYRTDGPQALRPVGESEAVVRRVDEAGADASAHGVCAGIVAHADLTLGDAAEAVIEAHLQAGAGRVRGIRHITARHEAFNGSLLARPRAGLLLEDGFRRGAARVAAAGLALDVAVYHTQLDEVAQLARALPALTLVVDHLGCPLGVGPYADRRDLALREWREALERLSACTNVFIKLGGLGVPTAGFRFHQQLLPPSSRQLAEAWAPYVHGAIDLFGAQRCMFQSNFPVDKAQFGYAVLWNAFKRLASGASADEKSWLFAGTARRAYRLASR